jgi:hypothetical protein
MKHVSWHVREYFNSHYPDDWIGRLGPETWPPRSPELTPRDYFLWGTHGIAEKISDIKSASANRGIR